MFVHMRWQRSELDAGQLWKSVKMSIARKQDQRVLENKSRNPHIVRRNGRALLAELPVQARVVMRGLIVGIDNADAWLQ